MLLEQGQESTGLCIWIPAGQVSRVQAGPPSASLPSRYPGHLSGGRGHCCQGQGRGLGPGVPHFLNSSFPIPAFIYLLAPRVSNEALRSPGSGQGGREARLNLRQIILTIDAEHRWDHENSGLGRIPGEKDSRACLGRRGQTPLVSLSTVCPHLFFRVLSFFLIHKSDLPHPWPQTRHSFLAFRIKMKPELVSEGSPTLGSPPSPPTQASHTVPHLGLSHAPPSCHHPEIVLRTQGPS